jgi:type II secretory pathway component GspD/PulD (secretin)
MGLKKTFYLALIAAFVLTALFPVSFSMAQNDQNKTVTAAVDQAPIPKPGILVTGDPVIASLVSEAPLTPAPLPVEAMPVVDIQQEFANSSKNIIAEEDIKPVVKDSKDERISLDLKGIDINEFFRVISMKMGVTIVPTKSVSGRINIFLNNITFEDALDVVIFSQDLAIERKGNIINVMTAAEYERSYGKKFNEKRKIESCQLAYAKPSVIFEALSQLKSEIGRVIVDESTGTIFMIDIPEKVALMTKTIKELDRSPVTQTFSIQYAKSSDIKVHLSNAITPGVGDIFVDERSNKVIVSDLPQKMKKIKEMIKAFDEPTKQVFIEGEVVQVTIRDEFTRGINWEKILSSKLNGMDFKGTFPLSSSFTPSPGLATDSMKISIGTSDESNYSAALQFLGTLGSAKLLSEPRIAVVNKEEARILVGSREAFVTQALSQGQSTTVTSESIQFIDVGVKLTVSPTINDEGFVTIKIKPEVSSVREVITTALGSRIPIVETSEAETVVKVKDGSMIMIAGLMKEEKRDDTTGIPGLSKIPIIGALFGAKAKQTKKTELIIFITPHIIAGDSSVAGNEPESLIPAAIMPHQVRNDIIDKNIAKIRLGPAGITKKESKAVIVNKTPLLNKAPAVSKKSNVRTSDVNEIGIKMKGLKDF